MKVLFISAETTPFIKVGGLSDVVGSLPKALSKLGLDCRVIVPKSKETDKYSLRLVKRNIKVKFADETESVSLYESILPKSKVKVLFIDSRSYFRNRLIYEKSSKSSKIKRSTRFSFFDKAVLTAIKEIKWQPDILHLHDFHTGFTSYLLQTQYEHDPFYQNTKTIFTIHRLASHGFTSEEILEDLGVDEVYFPSIEIDKADDGRLDMLVEGILSSDLVNTVSPTYAKEILTPKYGEKIEKILRRKRVYGVLNGIDYEIFNPQTDKNIYRSYNLKNWQEGKKENKALLQKELDLGEQENTPIFSFIGRLDKVQKGIDILEQAARILIQGGERVQFVILGTGNKQFEEKFRRLSLNYPRVFSANIIFDSNLAKKIYAGSDFLLIPSKFEPCGLIQMIAMRYGTIPLARETGGLKDSIKDNQTGFLFKEYSSKALVKSIRDSIKVFKNKETWKKMVEKAMKEDFSWDHSAKEYLKLYQKLKREKESEEI